MIEAGAPSTRTCDRLMRSCARAPVVVIVAPAQIPRNLGRGQSEGRAAVHGRPSATRPGGAKYGLAWRENEDPGPSASPHLRRT
jgi:hypothetical protein